MQVVGVLGFQRSAVCGALSAVCLDLPSDDIMHRNEGEEDTAMDEDNLMALICGSVPNSALLLRTLTCEALWALSGHADKFASMHGEMHACARTHTHICDGRLHSGAEGAG
eukprot:198370-Pelagomonas_calceolata.AAC.4